MLIRRHTQKRDRERQGERKRERERDRHRDSQPEKRAGERQNREGGGGGGLSLPYCPSQAASSLSAASSCRLVVHGSEFATERYYAHTHSNS